MPTKKQRINLTVDDDMNALFDDLAKLTGVPKTRLIMDFLREAEPAFRTMKKGLLMAKNSREKLPSVFIDLASQANQQTAIINKELAEMMSAQTDWVQKDD